MKNKFLYFLTELSSKGAPVRLVLEPHNHRQETWL